MIPRNFQGIALILTVVILGSFALIYPAQAETECKTQDCKIEITIKIAFSYNDSEIQAGQVAGWASDIESVWNGPDGFQLTGDCQCEVRFKVETMKITDPAQANCNPGPPGYHCVMITDYDQNPPRNQTAMQGAEFYRGYMYPPGVASSGQSLNGWWSDDMDEPHPTTGEDVHDAAHEAGHMMGLDDKEGGGIMTHTSGDNAKPTQQNIDDAVKNVCGPDACPDSCCCGNGVIDSAKGEDCDAFADPTGCGEDEFCCMTCCSCFRPICISSDEYTSWEDCEVGCKGGYGCYQNYKTGCWDCLRQSVVSEQIDYDPELARDLESGFHDIHESLEGSGNGISQEQLAMVRDMYNNNIASSPQVRDLLANERINFYIDDFGTVSIVNVGGNMESIQDGELPDPTMNMYSDMETLEAIMLGSLDPVDALKEGRIRYEGVGIVNWIRFAFANLAFSIAALLGFV
jgi:putative sterol carrier protein